MAKKKAAAYRLAKLSLTLRGISHNLGETNDSRFAHALHKGLYFDYMMARILRTTINCPRNSTIWRAASGAVCYLFNYKVTALHFPGRPQSRSCPD